MSATNGNGPHLTVTHARPLVLLRYRPGIVGETARTVHLAPLPTDGTGAISAYCGALHPDQVETVTPGHGMPCTRCVLSHVSTDGTQTTEDPTAAPALPSQDSVDVTPLTAATCYQAWGWPVSLRRDHVWLHLGGHTVALVIPMPLAPQVVAILRQRRCSPPVLAHPYVPEHYVLLAGERYGVSLPWPPGIHRVTATLLLPPTITSRGPITWIHPPEPDALQLCREIDVVAAVRTALSSPPPSSRPAHS
ncbi:MAG: hypothetical protein ACRDRX_26670 [Pseudonocardiaceae bacterium]